MAEGNGFMVPHLIVNRAQVVSDGCVACGREFASAPGGERTLSAAVGNNNSTYMFCAQCGDAIMGRVQLVTLLVGAFVRIFTMPLLVAVYVALYQDLMLRKGGADLEARMGALPKG